MSAEPTSLHAQRVRLAAARLGGLGFRVLRVHSNDKRPFGDEWQRKATDHPGILDDWFPSDTEHNIGVACGPQPNGLNLVAIDVDTRHGGMETWTALTDINGIPDTATHTTPTAGLHLFFDAPFPINNSGNLPPGIDVRGVGGQVVVPPSWRLIDGDVRVYAALGSRGLWEYTVAPLPEWLVEMLRPIERSIERHPSSPRPKSADGPVENADWLRDHWDWIGVLEAAGYEVVKQVGERVFLRHPTATSEWSCTVDPTDGRMNAYSTNMPAALRQAQINRDGSVSWSPYDWFVATEHDGSYSAATSAINARREPYGGGGRRARAADTATPVQDGSGGDDVSLNLPADFWERRPVLTHIRTAAWAAGCSPDALLIQTLARVATYVPPCYKLPGVRQGLIGKHQTLDFLGCVIAETSGGKTLAAGVGEDFVPAPDPPSDGSDPLIDFEQRVGSGEGIAEFFLVPGTYIDDEGKERPTNRKVIGKQALFMNVDEGTGFTNQADRKGTTIISTLASAWSGESLGQLNAATETRRLVQGGRVRICAVINMQDTNGHLLFSTELASVGFTGRLLFSSAHDPSAPPPDEQPSWPGALEWSPPPSHGLTNHYLTYDPAIMVEIKQTRWEILTKRVEISQHQSQYLLLRCKVAALLAILDDRQHVSIDDWDLATSIVTMSGACLKHLDLTHSSQSEVTAVTAAAFRMTVAQKAVSMHVRQLVPGWQAKILARLRKNGPTPWKGLKDIVDADRRAELRTVLDEMVSAGVLILDGSRFRLA